MKRNLLILLTILIQTNLLSQDVASEYFETLNSIDPVDNYELYLTQCDSILELKPNDFNSRFSKALILGSKDQYQREQEEYRSILLFDSTNADIYYNLVASYINEYVNLVYITKDVDYERKKSKRRNHWECLSDEKECMDLAVIILPLIRRAVKVDTNTAGEYPNLREMELRLREFMNEKE